MKRSLFAALFLLCTPFARAGDAPGCTASAPDIQEAQRQVALGVDSYRQGKMSLAIPAFDTALQLDPCNGYAHFYAWRLYALGGRSQEAYRQLDLAHQLLSDAKMNRTWPAVQHAIQLKNEPGAPSVKIIDPPLEHFFAKTLDCDGIPIRSAAVVDSDALILACGKVRLMLHNLPAARKNLVARGAELHIIGDHQGTSDLPEVAEYRHTIYVDAEGHNTDMNIRTRGVGGLKSSCGEENLLHLPGDRYGDGSDICIHEFAHGLMNNGLTDGQRDAIENQYHAALHHGLWKNAYAAVNAKEYWAELSMWYFGSHGQFVKTPDPACSSGPCPNNIPTLTTPGPDALRTYDPAGFALVNRIYSGQK